MKECRNHSENLTNRKIWFFCIETVLNKIFQLQKIYFFFDEKKSQKNVWEKFSKKHRFFFEIEILHEKNLKTYDEKKSQKFSFLKIFENIFFDHRKKKSGVEIFLTYYFDAKKAQLSIGGIFRTIPWLGTKLQRFKKIKKKFFFNLEKNISLKF